MMKAPDTYARMDLGGLRMWLKVGISIKNIGSALIYYMLYIYVCVCVLSVRIDVDEFIKMNEIQRRTNTRYARNFICEKCLRTCS